MKRSHVALVCLALLVVGLALRIPGLGSFLTPDEGDWGKNTAQFLTALLHRDWPATLTFAYPGVTVTWAGTIGLVLKALLAPLPGTAGLVGLAAALATMPNRLDFLPWLRLPVVLFCTLGIVGIFLLARRLLGDATALLGIALLALDPFFLAHSRLIQTDAILTICSTIAWLAFLLAVRDGRHRWYLLSGIALGAAVLTKSPAIALAPLMAGWLLWQARRAGRSWRASLGLTLAGLLWAGLPAIVTFCLFWPAMWAAPFSTLGRVAGLVLAFGTRGHELGSYWLGQPVDAPGPGFYLAVLLWRTTPITLAGLVLAAWAWFPAARRRAPGVDGVTALSGLWLFVLWYAIVVTLSDKKFDRYLLPVFPAADLLAAWGWLEAGRRVASRLTRGPAGGEEPRATHSLRGDASTWRRYLAPAAVILLIGVQAIAAWTARPTYLTGFNALLGGAVTAQRVMLVGWGEGLPEAAQFLNRVEGASPGSAATWYGQNVFHAFYHGQSYDLYYDTPTAANLYAHDVDYVVTYLNQEQRHLVDPSVRQKLNQPLFTSRYGDVLLAQVYRWPKPFDHTTDQTLASGLRLLGWDLGKYDAASRQVTVTLYWDANQLRKDVSPESMMAWLKDDAGEVWATAGPVAPQPQAGQNGTDGWQGQPVAGQVLSLRLPFGLHAGSYRLEMAPYGGKGIALGEVNLPGTRWDAAARQRDLQDGWQPLSQDVKFGSDLQLAGYSLENANRQLVLDLLWAPGSAPIEDYQYFVHVTGADDRILAQADGRLGMPGDEQTGVWHAGQVNRQRVRLNLPQGVEAGPHRVYVGLYRSPAGPRIPLSVDGLAVSDGRYLLTTLSTP